MSRSPIFRAGVAISALSLSGCATLNGVPQTPCQRATRAVAAAHAAVDAARAAINVAVTAGADPVAIARANAVVDKAEDVANAAALAAATVCAANPAPPAVAQP